LVKYWLIFGPKGEGERAVKRDFRHACKPSGFVHAGIPGKNAPAAFLMSWARDRAPLRQGDMPGDGWVIGTGRRLRIRCLLLDRRGGSLEGCCRLLFRAWMLINIRRCRPVGTCHIRRGRRQSLIGFYLRWRGDKIGETPCHGGGD
jgi:hypothetical protein